MTLANRLREPLLHFLVLGGLLFAGDYLLVDRGDDPLAIVVDPKVDREARQVFEAARGRRPDKAELDALRQNWLDNEVLYREGLALGVDKGDKAIRDRVIFKMLSVVEAGLKRPPIDEKVLREWFEENRARYDEPPRFDFEEAVLSGERTEANVRALVETLKVDTHSEIDAGLRVFKGRPRASIVQSYGPEFATALEQSTVEEWQALQTRAGWRAVRLRSVTPARAADFEVLRGVVLQDWTDAVMAEQRTAAVRALAAKYKIKYESPAQ